MPSGPEAAYGYNVPNLLVDHAMRNPHLTPGFWRGVNTNQNAVYMECFMDELAEAAGQDPLAFRLKHAEAQVRRRAQGGLRQGGLRQAAARRPLPRHRPDHGLRQLRRRRVRGLGQLRTACSRSTRSRRPPTAGHVVNPAQIERQVAGSFVYGLSAALYGEITVKDGVVEQTNFDSYNVMRMDEMPKVETVLVPSGGFWGGVGEPTIAVAAPAVLNAIYKATGKRVRELPLMHQELKKGA